MELFIGRPSDSAGRLEKELKSYDFLDFLGVEYSRVDHQPAMTMDICAEISRTLGANICKNLFLCNRQETDFYLLMMPADKIFKTKFLSASLVVSRLSFADEKYMFEYLNITPGSVSVLGLINDIQNRVRLVIDREILCEQYVGCHPCINTSSVKFTTSDFLDKIIPALGHQPTVIDLMTE